MDLENDRPIKSNITYSKYCKYCDIIISHKKWNDHLQSSEHIKMEYTVSCVRMKLKKTLIWCDICQDYYSALNRIAHDMSLNHINRFPKDSKQAKDLHFLRLCFGPKLWT